MQARSQAEIANQMNCPCRRIATIAGHLHFTKDASERLNVPKQQPTSQVDHTEVVTALSDVLEAHGEARLRFEEFLCKNADLYRARSDEFPDTMDKSRVKVRERLETFLQSGLVKVEDVIEDPMAFFSCHEALGLVDPSLVYCLSVHLNLFGGSVLKLGSEKHHTMCLDERGGLRSGGKGSPLIQAVSHMNAGLRGCFALTELVHGANSGAFIDTLATYDHASQTFTINTPHDGAQKAWVSFAAQQATHTILWADLVVEGTTRGPHLFIVQLRDTQTEECLPGVYIFDRGAKSCLNGNDNARMAFDNVKVPASALLDRHTRIDPATGEYSSDFKKPQEMFGKFTDALLSGRLVVTTCACLLGRQMLNAAIRYACSRRIAQRRGDPLPLIVLSSHSTALMPRLAQMYALTLAVNYAKRAFAAHTRKHFLSDGSLRDHQAAAADTDLLSLEVCALKGHVLQQALEVLSVCKACCGGQGTIADNRLGEYDNVLVTLSCAEGDTVLMQQKTARQLLGPMLKGEMPVEPECPSDALMADAGDLAALEALLELRQVRLLMGLGQKMMALQGEGMGMMDAWNKRCLPEAQLLHRAYCEHLVFAQFRKAIDQVPSGAAATLLSRHAALYGCWLVQRAAGWFLTHTDLPKEVVSVLEERLEGLIRSVTMDEATAMVDAFKFPAALLSYPMANGNWQTSQFRKA